MTWKSVTYCHVGYIGYEAFSRGDLPSVLGVFDPNIVWSEAEGSPYRVNYSATRHGCGNFRAEFTTKGQLKRLWRSR
jgi:ketosteroid isomerase-like protein